MTFQGQLLFSLVVEKVWIREAWNSRGRVEWQVVRALVSSYSFESRTTWYRSHIREWPDFFIVAPPAVYYDFQCWVGFPNCHYDHHIQNDSVRLFDTLFFGIWHVSWLSRSSQSAGKAPWAEYILLLKPFHLPNISSSSSASWERRHASAPRRIYLFHAFLSFVKGLPVSGSLV